MEQQSLAHQHQGLVVQEVLVLVQVPKAQISLAFDVHQPLTERVIFKVEVALIEHYYHSYISRHKCLPPPSIRPIVTRISFIYHSLPRRHYLQTCH